MVSLVTEDHIRAHVMNFPQNVDIKNGKFDK